MDNHEFSRKALTEVFQVRIHKQLAVKVIILCPNSFDATIIDVASLDSCPNETLLVQRVVNVFPVLIPNLQFILFQVFIVGGRHKDSANSLADVTHEGLVHVLHAFVDICLTHSKQVIV
jgi:hypothetical protein